MPTLDRGDPRPLPAFENPAQKSGGQIAAPLADRQIPRVIQNQAMPHVESRIPALVEERKAVPRERAVRLLPGHQRIVRIVNGMRVGVDSLELEALGEA